MRVKPQRIQLRRAKGWRMPPNTVKVDRTSQWGNPFIVGKHGSRSECVKMHRMLMGGYICLSTGPDWKVQQAFLKWCIEHIGELRGKNLACWCPLPAPGEEDECHAAVYLRAANKRCRP